MMHQRFTRILRILSSLVGSTISTSTKDHLTSKNYGAFECLPDCIINILSRLPIDCTLKCRRVCRLWKALISSHYFATLLHDREKFFIQYDELDFFVLEENDSKQKVFKKVSLKPELTMRKYHPRLLHS
ncbi:hypothetical protein HAX54_002690 [Datura stramonium]|uniref:F-box domain-containing protein n=1 Tax=Datura stramonium TaxID=4076 RepID=A0ABS8RT19_DATST|nr:hypothetical protein [Datura stramonium]